MILAMYDIRGKQKYIFSSNKLKEIMGASYLIKDVFKDNLPETVVTYKVDTNAKDQNQAFETYVKEKFDHGIVGININDNGGNCTVIYKDFASYQETNKKFYYKLFSETHALRVLSSYVEIENFNDYRNDYRRLREVHQKDEREEFDGSPMVTLPFVQVNRLDSDPLVTFRTTEKEKVSFEANAKLKKYDDSDDAHDKENVKQLDKLVEKKGEDSYLAIVYIDGNNMGAKVQAYTEQSSSGYGESIARLKQFSESIDNCFVKVLENDVFGKVKVKRRLVVHAGDEVNIICAASDAIALAKQYFDSIVKSSDFKQANSCAGIAMFHSHDPYSEAYRIAEECCESGKKMMKKHPALLKEACLMDYHLIQGAIGTSLEDIRKHEETNDISRPWVYFNYQDITSEKYLENDLFDYRVVEEMIAKLEGIGHSNAKTLFKVSKLSERDYQFEVSRIARNITEKDKCDFSLDGKLNLKQQMKLIYDIMLIYDRCFKKKEEEDRETEN